MLAGLAHALVGLRSVLLDYVHTRARDPPGLVVSEHVRLPDLVLVSPEVRVGERLPVGVADDNTGCHPSNFREMYPAQ
ncbi:MAG TPA: hypothetical protein VF014_16420 [Casimicrobiaceae bacterium]|nr:hypothetical protein [Casimicrobiaceae bacterium]